MGAATPTGPAIPFGPAVPFGPAIPFETAIPTGPAIPHRAAVYTAGHGAPASWWLSCLPHIAFTSHDRDGHVAL